MQERDARHVQCTMGAAGPAIAWQASSCGKIANRVMAGDCRSCVITLISLTDGLSAWPLALGKLLKLLKSTPVATVLVVPHGHTVTLTPQ